MDNSGDKSTPENPHPNPDLPADEVSDPRPPRPSRTPFTSLSQVDADLALARALQDQERAYMMLMMNGGHHDDGLEEGSDENLDDEDVEEVDGDDHAYLIHDDEDDDEEEEEEEGSEYEEDAFDANVEGIDPADFDGDEAYARALQEAEEREIAVRLMAMAGLGDWAAEHHGDNGNNTQDIWQEVDPDELSYEELVALGEVVGTESRGLSSDTIASLPSVNYKAQSGEDGIVDQCVICRLDYEDGESLVLLSCKHTYHSECINRWLQINKVCPVCSAEVSTSVSKQD